MLPLAALTLACALQCTDPPTPSTGFTYFEAFDQEVTFSDGETTTAVARWPRGEAPSCGWPAIVFVHGLFGSKAAVAHLGREFADAGYFTVTFDVRGHATSSGNHSLWGLRERLDLVEVVQWAQSSYPGLVDPQRLGLGGTSQGAILSFGAAAWGGRPIEPNPWIAGTYPEIDVIVVENLTPDFLATFAPQSLGVHTNVAAALISENDVRFDPGLIANALHALLEEDYPSWAAIVGDNTRNPRPLVPTMTTPVMAMSAWDDFWFPVAPLIDALDALPTGVPRKIYLGAGGHSTPPNVAERDLRTAWRRQWFDHFLKQVDNGIELGDRILYAVTPADVATYLDVDSTWERRTCDAWPPPATRAYRMHLREGAHLWPFDPNGPESQDVLTQDVTGGYSINDVIAADFRLPGIEAEIERRKLDWDSAQLVAPLRITGDPSVHLTLTPTTTRWQIAASLWDVDASGAERYVTSGSYFSHDQLPASAELALEIRLGSAAYVFPAGHRIRVRLENLHVHEPPVGTLLRYAPTVSSFALSVRHDLGGESWLDLPIADADAVSYGWSQVASNGCVASVTAQGQASVTTQQPFEIRATEVVGQRDGLVIYGLGARKVFLNGGFLFVAGPIRRGELLHSGGNGPQDCSGAMSYDFNARIRSGLDPALTPGARVFAQYWIRDPAAAGTTNLTNAVEFSIFP